MNFILFTNNVCSIYRYLQKNALSLLSVNDYMSVTPEYLRKVG